jgi:spermidine synthase
VVECAHEDAGRELAADVLERREGRCGELVLRRCGYNLEVVANGAFLISTANEASSRAVIAAALPQVGASALDVLIGGLGLGYALDEALACERVRRVTVVELEPDIERWFRDYGGERARRAVIGERDGRAEIVVGDVRDVLVSSLSGFDVVALDTDNGPEWLVRDGNAWLYSGDGIRLVHRSLRRGGAGVFWSPDRYSVFEERLAAVFDRVVLVPARDVVDGKGHDYTMYVGLRGSGPDDRG